MLPLLDEVFTFTVRNPFLKLIVTLEVIEQKSWAPLYISKIVEPDSVCHVSAHAACNIQAADPQVVFLWSRCVLQNLCGERGQLYTCLVVHEAVDFQSNLDRRPVDFGQFTCW